MQQLGAVSEPGSPQLPVPLRTDTHNSFPVDSFVVVNWKGLVWMGKTVGSQDTCKEDTLASTDRLILRPSNPANGEPFVDKTQHL